MTTQLAPTPLFRASDNNGAPLVGGKLFTYVAGTTTPQASWIDATQTTQNTNPVILNSRGEASVWLDITLTYKLVLQDSTGNSIWTQDQVPGGYVTPAQFPVLFNQNLTPTAVGKTIYPQTPQELNAGITPANFFYPQGDIRRYGSTDPTGVGDSTAAIQAAFNVGVDVYIPPGQWKITTTITLVAHILSNAVASAARLIHGAGRGISILNPQGAIHCFTCNDALPSIACRDFSIASLDTTTLDGFHFNNICYDSSFIEMEFVLGGRGVFMPVSGTFGASFSNVFINCFLNSYNNHCVEVAGGPATTFINCYHVTSPVATGFAGFRVYAGATWYNCNSVNTGSQIVIIGQEVALGDSTNTQAAGVFIGCNFENFGFRAVEMRFLGSINFRNCSFLPPNAAYDCSVFIRAANNGVTFDNCNFVGLNGSAGIGAAWQASTAYIVGQFAVNNGHLLTCVTAGTSGGSFTSNTSNGQVDGTVTWNFLSVANNTAKSSDVYCNGGLQTPVMFTNCGASVGVNPGVGVAATIHNTTATDSKSIAVLGGITTDGMRVNALQTTLMTQLAGTLGISGTTVQANNLRGSGSTSATTTSTVTFGTAEANSSYFLSVTLTSGSGVISSIAKSGSNFVITWTGSVTNTYDWMLIR